MDNSLNEKLLNIDSNEFTDLKETINYIEYKDNDTNNLELQDNKFLSNLTLKNIYNYYIYNGYFTIFSIQIIKFFSSGFLILSLFFLIKCLDYNGLKKLNNTHNNFENFINLRNIINLGIYEYFLLIVLLIYFVLRISVIINELRRYYKIKIFYEKKLKLKNYDLIKLEWIDIVDRIKFLYGKDYNIYNINSRILKKDNFLILLSKTYVKKYLFSKLMEINIIECIINNIVNIKSSNIIINNDKLEIINKEELKYKCIYKLLFLSALTFITMPFLIVYIMFFSFLKYGEKFYNEPNKCFNKQLNNNSNNKLRYYNEFKEDFNKRMTCFVQYSKEYMDLFNPNYIKIILKFIIFILSSIFIILVCLSLYNEKILLNLNISKGKPVLWYLGIFGSVIAILKNITKETKKNIEKSDIIYKKITQLNQLLDYDNKLENDYKRIDNINNHLSYQIVVLIKESFSVLFVPFYLISICNYISSIILFLENNIDYDDVNGIIVKKSNFRKLNNNSAKDSLLSFNQFRNKFPTWGANIEIYQIGDLSVFKNSSRNNFTIFDNTIDSNISII